MNSPFPDSARDKLQQAFDAYAAELEQLTPSPDLDSRMRQSIDRELSLQRRSRRWRPAATWAIAASAALVMSVTAWQVHQLRLTQAARDALVRTQQPAPAPAAMLQVFPAGAVSLWPTEATVFRVRSSLGAPNTEHQYWLDVRMANDGSMRIERVLSADGSELFVRPGTNP